MSANLEELTTLDEIVFQHRNQEYGAFQIRKSYPSTLNKSALQGSILFTFVIVLMFCVHLWLDSKQDKTDLSKEVTAEVMRLAPAPPVKKQDELAPPPPKEIPKVTTTKFLPPEIRPDDDPTPAVRPPEQDKIKGNPGRIDALGDVNEGQPDGPELEEEPPVIPFPINNGIWEWPSGKSLQSLIPNGSTACSIDFRIKIKADGTVKEIQANSDCESNVEGILTNYFKNHRFVLQNTKKVGIGLAVSSKKEYILN
ncbi:hypothetical protein G9H61_09575 [Aquirufa ecclesiirivi]|uniref:Energy transducer TonB n=1 Tax=Aquirufa ecclesiirivi TaxID=2715124 RepID=A0ABT4JHE2_9BACT|nr:hypothetical protein [Aquirufa ecclesiirivi]MCZ2473661.1 hypothetical protein [Aquirufa ecclesiirivi]MCZ2475696.1 hypothetical protein [Aquirufa ecclesiirivi]